MSIFPRDCSHSENGIMQVLHDGLLCQKGEMFVHAQRLPMQVFPFWDEVQIR